MEQYLGVKLVKAEPAKGYKNKLYTAASPAGVETQEGYKVVYEDGYTSWSPKDVFEKAYRKINNNIPIDKLIRPKYQDRVIEEADELQDKIEKLKAFINNGANFYQTLDKEEQNRLKQQLMAMQYYLTILVERIENF